MRAEAAGQTYLAAELAEKIVRLIRSEGLVEGDELPSERQLADTFDASMRVVREALRQLVHQGVVLSQQGRRSKVAGLQPVAIRGYFRLLVGERPDALDELLAFRLVVETAAAGLAAQNISDDEFAELSDVLEAIAATEPVDRLMRAELDLKFHTGIARASGNVFVASVSEALSDALAYERLWGLQLTEDAGDTHADSDAEHLLILKAIEDHDGATASAMMQRHLQRVRMTLGPHIKRSDLAAPAAHGTVA